MLEKLLRWTVLAGIFALPFVVLIVAQTMFFPYITGKNFTFRIIVEVITGAWLALTLVDTKYRPKKSWILGAFALFVLAIAIADAQGVNPFKSFWSNYERMDGWVTLAHLLMYFTVAYSVILSEKLWRLVFQTSIAVSLFVSLYGFLQVVGFVTLDQGGTAGLSARIDATFGNPIYLAVYMLFHIFIAALLWVQMWHVRPAGKRLPASIYYGLVIFIDTVVLLFTGTRGTILGLIGGGIITLLLIAFLRGSSKVKTYAIVSMVVLVICAIGLKAGQDLPIVQKIGFLQRLATISLNDSTTKSRLLNAEMAWQGVKERPVFGWGQENYAIVFDKYYDPRMYGQEPWFDRTHDIIFDWLVAGGIVGLLTYLSIFAVTLWYLWRTDAFMISERSIITGLLAGYFFHNLFVFDNVTSYILFATVLSYIAWRVSESLKSKPILGAYHLPKAHLPFVLVVVIILTWGDAWWVNADAITANRELLQALSQQQNGPLGNLALFKSVIDRGTFGTQEAREQLSQITAQIAGANVGNDVKQQFLTYAGSQMLEQEKASPLDARFPLFLGILLDQYGDFSDAATQLNLAHTLSPAKQSILYELAINARVRNDHAAELGFYKQAFDVLPENNDARLYYAADAISQGNMDLADQLLAPLIPTGDAADPRIASAYMNAKRYDKIETIWQALVAVQPKNIQAYFTLAAAYYAGGDSQSAIGTLQAAEKQDASYSSQIDQLIADIKSGKAKLQ